MDKQLPSDVDCEAGILAQMILFPETIPQIKLVPSAFYNTKFGKLFGYIRSMFNDKTINISLDTTYEYLVNTYKDKTITAFDLTKIVDYPVPSNLQNSIDKLYSLAVKRKAIKELTPVLTACYDNESNIAETASSAMSNLQSTINATTKKVDIFKTQSLAEKVRGFIDYTKNYTGDNTFSIQELHKTTQVTAKSDIHNINNILQRLKADGVIKKYKGPAGKGHWEILDTTLERVDYHNLPEVFFNVKFPMGMEKICRLLPKSICCVAGEKDQGKTTWLLNFVRLNQNRGKNIRYFSSEAGAFEFAFRLKGFEREFNMKANEWTFELYERSGDFSAVIDPEAINIIDFIEFKSNQGFWEIAAMMTTYQEALTSGIVVCALQKTPGKIYGAGGAKSIEKPRIYITLSENYPKGHVAKILSGKVPSEDLIEKGRVARGYSMPYTLHNGAVLRPLNGVSEWTDYDELVLAGVVKQKEEHN